jgi:hypothetical protein
MPKKSKYSVGIIFGNNSMQIFSFNSQQLVCGRTVFLNNQYSIELFVAINLFATTSQPFVVQFWQHLIKTSSGYF